MSSDMILIPYTHIKVNAVPDMPTNLSRNVKYIYDSGICIYSYIMCWYNSMSKEDSIKQDLSLMFIDIFYITQQ